jgi:hypothetical protein
MALSRKIFKSTEEGLLIAVTHYGEVLSKKQGQAIRAAKSWLSSRKSLTSAVFCRTNPAARWRISSVAARMELSELK